MSKLIRTSMVVLSLLGLPLTASAVVIDFDSIDNTSGNRFSGSSLNTDGFNFSNSRGYGSAILHWYRGSSYNADSDGATYSHNYSGTVTTVTKIGGGSFDLASLDIGNVYNSRPYSQRFSFWATVAGGGSYNMSFISDSLAGLQTVMLNWSNLTSFSFRESSGSWLQADNFVIDENVSVPEPSTLALLTLGLLGLGVARRRVSA